MSLISQFKDKKKRHMERHESIGFNFIISDQISLLNPSDWDSMVIKKSIFMTRNYLKVMEKNSPSNTVQRYALAYQDGQPVVALICQVADIKGGQLRKSKGKFKKSLVDRYKERILVCGNLMSNGAHGVSFSENLNEETGWRIVAELLYRIRRGENLSGKIDFVLMKDLTKENTEHSKVLERYSYRLIKTDPDMVLELGEDVKDFESYMEKLSSKYRKRIKKISSTMESEGFKYEITNIVGDRDSRLHALYAQVESNADIRLAAVPKGYFRELAENLGKNFSCALIKKDEDVVGFVTVIKDQQNAVAYYAGFDYLLNVKFPIYHQLLQLSILMGIQMGCKRVHLGRTALEPKANLGAKPQASYVWARHRVPAINFWVRKIFKLLPSGVAPERNVFKSN